MKGPEHWGITVYFILATRKWTRACRKSAIQLPVLFRSTRRLCVRADAYLIHDVLWEHGVFNQRTVHSGQSLTPVQAHRTLKPPRQGQHSKLFISVQAMATGQVAGLLGARSRAAFDEFLLGRFPYASTG